MVPYVQYLHKKFSTPLCLLLPKLLMCIKKARPTPVHDGKCGFGHSQSTLFTLFVPTVFTGFYLASKVSCVVGCCVLSFILSDLHLCHGQFFICLLLFHQRASHYSFFTKVLEDPYLLFNGTIYYAPMLHLPNCLSMCIIILPGSRHTPATYV